MISSRPYRFLSSPQNRCEHVIDDVSLEMPDVASLLMTSKVDGKIIAEVVGHVVD